MELEEKFRLNPENAGIFRELVAQYQAQSQWEKLAAAYLERGVFLKKQDAREAAMHLLEAGRYQEHYLKNEARASELFGQAFSLDPENQMAFAAVESSYTNGKKWKELYQIYSDRLDITEDRKIRLELLRKAARLCEQYLNQPDQAVSLYSRARELDPKNGDILRALAILFESQNQTMAAIEIWQSLLKMADSPEVRDKVNLQIGMLCEKMGDRDRASTYYRAITGSAYQAEALSRLEQVYDKDPANLMLILTQKLESIHNPATQVATYKKLAQLEQKREAAIAFYQRALEISPKDGEILKEIARIFWDKGQIEVWYEYQLRLLQAMEGVSDKVRLLHDVAEKMGDRKDQRQAVVKCYEMILETMPQDRQAIEKLIHIYRQDKRPEALLKVLLHKSKYCSLAERVATYFQVAKLLSESLNLEEEAKVYYKKVLELQEDNYESLDHLKEQHMKTGNYQELLDVMQKKISLDPGRAAEYHAEIGKIYRDLVQDLDKSIDAFAKSIDADPRYWPAYESVLPLLLSKSQWERYVAIAERALLVIKDPHEKVQLSVQVAEVYLKNEQHQHAEEHLLAVLRYNPAHGQVLEKLAAIYQQQRRWQNYIEILEASARFLGTHEDMPRRYVEIARVHASIKQYAEALRFYERAHHLSPFSEEIVVEMQQAAEQTQQEDKIIYCLALRARSNDNSEQALGLLMQLGQLYLKRKENERAIQVYEDALSRRPYNLDIIDALLRLYAAKNEHRKHFDLLERKSRLLQKAEQLAAIYESMAGIAEQQLGRTELAIDSWEKVLRLYPQQVQAIDHLLMLYPRQQMWQALARLYRQKLALANDDTQGKLAIWRELAKLYEEHLDDPWELKNVYKQILATSPDDTAVLTALQKLCHKLQDWQGVIDAYQQEVQVCKNDARLLELFQEMGKIYQSYLPNIEQAIHCFHKALEYDPENYEIWKNLHYLYLLKHDYQHAIGMIDRELKLLADPELEANLLVEKGILYRDRLFNPKLATQSFENALSLCPTFMEAIEALEVVYRRERKYGELLQLLINKQNLVAAEEAVEIQVEIARLYQEHLDKDGEAEQFLLKVVNQHPLHAEAGRRLVRIYHKHGKWDKLNNFYQGQLPYLRDARQKAGTLLAMGKLWEEKLRDVTKAASYYVQVLNLESANLPAIKSLQKIYEKENRGALAEAYLAELAVPEILPRRRITLHLTCAELFVNQSEKKELAVTHYQQVLKLDPDNVLAMRGLASVYRERKQYAELAKVLLSELSLEKDNRRVLLIHLELADVFSTLQDGDEVIKQLGKAHRLQPQDSTIMQRLKAVLRDKEYWGQYVECLHEEMEQFEIAAEKQQYHLELGHTYQERLKDSAKAIEHLEQACLLGQVKEEELHLLQELYVQGGIGKNAPNLIAAYEKELAITNDTRRTAELWMRIGDIYDQHLNVAAKAAAAFEEVLKRQPLRREAYDLLIKLYIKLEAWPKLAQLLLDLVQIVSEQKEKEDLLLKISNIWEKKLQDNVHAMGYYQMTLTLNPKNLAALQGMRRLNEADKNWHGVLALLYQEADISSGSDRATIYLKIAKIWETRLNLIRQAVDAYLEVLKNYFHQGTAEHLLNLLKGMKEYELFCEVIPKVIRRTKEADARAALLTQLGDVLWRELNRSEEAVQVYQKALLCVPKKVDALAGLEDIYQKLELWPELAKIKEQKLEMITSSTQIRKLHLELGTICENRLYNEKKAIFHYERALELSPHDFSLMHTLERLYQDWGYFHRYIEVCQRECEVCEDIERRKGLYLEIARTWEYKLLDDIHAIQSLEKILESERNHGEAIISLLRLYERNHDYRNLVRLYEIEAEKHKQQGKQQEWMQLKLNIGRVLKDQLYDHTKAEQVFREVLQVAPKNQEALLSLEKMFQTTNNLLQLSEIISHKIQLSQDLMEKSQLYIQLGQIYEKQPDSIGKAVDAYAQAHAIQPQHRLIVESLRRLYRAAGNVLALVQANQELSCLTEKDSDKVALYWENCILLKGMPNQDMLPYLEKIVALQPQHGEAMTMLLDILQKQNQWDKLEKYLGLWIQHESDPKKQAALYARRGEVYLRQLNARDKAIADFVAVLDKEQTNLEVTLTLADIHYQSQSWDKAEPLYALLIRWPEQEALKSRNWGEIAFRWGKLAEHMKNPQVALLRYQKLLDVQAEHLGALKALGNIYYENKQWEQALLVYMKLNNLKLCEAEQAEVSLRLAIIKDKLGMTEGAIEGYLQVLEKNPQDTVVLESLGSLYLARKEEEKAYQCFQRLRQIVSEPASKKRTLVWLGKIGEAMHDVAGSILAYEELLALQGVAKEWLRKLLPLYVQAKSWDKAAQCGEQVYQMLTNDLEKVEIEMALGQIMWEGYHNQDKAFAYYEAVLAKVPTYLAAVRAIAGIYQSQENWEEVVNTYHRCMQRFPAEAKEQKIPLLLEQAKIMQEKLNKAKEAIPLYEKVLEIAPDHAGAHASLAVLWAKYPEKRGDAITGQLYLINEDPFRVLSYHELFRLLMEDKEHDRAYLCGQALDTLGALLPEESKFLKQVPSRVPSGWLDPWTLDQLVREGDRRTVYEIMASVDPYTDKAYPPAIEEKYQLRRQDKVMVDGEGSLSTMINTTMRLLGIQELSAYTCDKETIAVENTLPATLIVGRPLIERLTPGQLHFAISHHLFYVSRNHVMAAKLSTAEYVNYVHRLVEAFADTGKQMSIEEENISRKLRLALARKIRKQLEERMDLMGEMYQADIPSFLKALELAANKCGLLCADSLKDSVQAYLFMRSKIFPLRGGQSAVAEPVPDQFAQIPEVKDMFWFNISEDHSKLRAELGLAIRWVGSR